MSTGCSLLLTAIFAAALAARAQDTKTASDPGIISDQGQGMARAHMTDVPAPVLPSTRTAFTGSGAAAASGTKAAPAASKPAGVRAAHVTETEARDGAGRLVGGRGDAPDLSKGQGVLQDANGHWIEVLPAGAVRPAGPSGPSAPETAPIPASPAQSATPAPAEGRPGPTARLGWFALGAAVLAALVAFLKRA